MNRSHEEYFYEDGGWKWKIVTMYNRPVCISIGVFATKSKAQTDFSTSGIMFSQFTKALENERLSKEAG